MCSLCICFAPFYFRNKNQSIFSQRSEFSHLSSSSHTSICHFYDISQIKVHLSVLSATSMPPIKFNGQVSPSFSTLWVATRISFSLTVCLFRLSFLDHLSPSYVQMLNFSKTWCLDSKITLSLDDRISSHGFNVICTLMIFVQVAPGSLPEFSLSSHRRPHSQHFCC